MSLSNNIKHNHDAGSLTLSDGDDKTLVVRFEAGAFELSGLVKGLQEVVHYEGRGKRRSSRYSKRKYPTGRFDVQVAELSEGTSGTVQDWFLKRAPFATRNSTNTLGDVDTTDLTYQIDGIGTEADQTYEIGKIHATDISFKEGEPNMLSVAFEVLGSVGINGADAYVAPEEA